VNTRSFVSYDSVLEYVYVGSCLHRPLEQSRRFLPAISDFAPIRHFQIFSSGGSRVFFASKHVIALQIKRKVLARVIIRAKVCARSIGIGAPMDLQKKLIYVCVRVCVCDKEVLNFLRSNKTTS